MSNHEYTLMGGANRSWIGKILATAFAALSGLLIFVLLLFVDAAGYLGWHVNIPPAVFSLVGTGVIWALLYPVFDKWLWKLAGKVVTIPNLAGTWSCDGETLNHDGSVAQAWQGTVTIDQSWDRMWIRLRTDQSGSDSIAASMVCNDPEGFRLLYSYRNQPRLGQADMRGHTGCADILFSRDGQSAEGDYFNGYGRSTSGRMKLTRI